MNILRENYKTLEKNAKQSVVIVGIAPIEEHGHHLPLGVDFFLTSKWIEDTIDSLSKEHKDKTFYSMPTIPMGNANIKGFAGNLHVSQKLIYQMTKEILTAIANWGVKNIIIISGHADPKHLIAIEEACDEINKNFGIIAFSPMGALFSQENANIDLNHDIIIKETLDTYPNDFHAGWVETSLMLYYNSTLVNPVYKNAEDIVIEPKMMAFPNKVNKKIAGVGHIGYPSKAKAELGEKLHSNMIETLHTSIDCFIKRIGYEKYAHHFLYKIPFLRVNKLRRK